MRKLAHNKLRWWAVAMVLVITALPAIAQDFGESVEIHGFGEWAFGDTDGNSFLAGSKDGKYDNAAFALNVTANPSERLTVVAQMRLDASDNNDDIELDYAFAGWMFNDALQLKVGRVKHPFGIYGEIVDVGTLRPFQLLPQSIYGGNGLTARSYNGAGLTGSTDLGSNWGVDYDLYVGQIEGDFQVPGLLSTVPDLFLEPLVNVGFEVADTFGGRLTLTTPVDGLSFGISAYTGKDQLNIALEGILRVDRTVYLVGAEYLTERLSLRSEWAHLENETQFESDAWYVEAAVMLNENWQLAGRWDDFDLVLDVDRSILPPFFSQLENHDEVAFGVNYWFSPGFVLRLNYHQIEGNRLAYPGTAEEVGRVLFGLDELKNKTDMFLFGAQFSF